MLASLCEGLCPDDQQHLQRLAYGRRVARQNSTYGRDRTLGLGPPDRAVLVCFGMRLSEAKVMVIFKLEKISVISVNLD